MGAYSPLPWAPPTLVADVTERVLQPMVDAMRHRGTPFSGLLYAGLAMTSRGVRVIEFNARFGDPETQVVLANLRSPLGQVLMAAATGRLAEIPHLVWQSGYAVTVVIAAEGYPASPRTGDVIEGLAEAADQVGVDVFHAGTTVTDDGEIASVGRPGAVGDRARGDARPRARARLRRGRPHPAAGIAPPPRHREEGRRRDGRMTA